MIYMYILQSKPVGTMQVKRKYFEMKKEPWVTQIDGAIPSSAFPAWFYKPWVSFVYDISAVQDLSFDEIKRSWGAKNREHMYHNGTNSMIFVQRCSTTSKTPVTYFTESLSTMLFISSSCTHSWVCPKIFPYPLMSRHTSSEERR